MYRFVGLIYKFFKEETNDSMNIHDHARYWKIEINAINKCTHIVKTRRGQSLTFNRIQPIELVDLSLQATLPIKLTESSTNPFSLDFVCNYINSHTVSCFVSPLCIDLCEIVQDVVVYLHMQIVAKIFY